MWLLRELASGKCKTRIVIETVLDVVPFYIVIEDMAKEPQSE